MNILMVGSELTPIVKTGGLADVVAALSSELKARGHDVRIVLPFYSTIGELKGVETEFDSMCVSMGEGEEWCAVRRWINSGNVPVYLIEHNGYFAREGIYHDDNYNDYQDNPRRFGFLCRAALQYCIDSKFAPDIVHCNDWQTAAIPAYLKNWFWDHPVLSKTASVLTIHNIAYQGTYPAQHMNYLGLGWQHFTADKFESFGQLNLLKGGIAFADAVNTVSPGHAKEITAPYGGFGLAPYLLNKGNGFLGILNGVDYNEWDPQTDRHLPAHFSADDLSGKAICKRRLQQAFKLEERPDVALIGVVGRFAEQKGYHLVREAIEDILWEMQVQFVILGSGDSELQAFFGNLPGQYPGRIGSWIGYNNSKSHLIQAGSDFFLMPSLFEPCGLTQMYSLHYGTLPIVRATGGLNDTIDQYDELTGEGTGFKFQAMSSHALRNTVGWAVSTYYDRPDHMQQMIIRAMKKDFSWHKEVINYESFYNLAKTRKTEYDYEQRAW